MKTLIFSIALIVGTSVSTAQADAWTWTPISNGSTLNAHLARCNLARPNPMVVFSMIAEIQKRMLAPSEKPSSPRS